MPFVPRLPTWNQPVRIFRLQIGGIWTPDAADITVQFYFGQRVMNLTWVDEYQTVRGTPGTGDWQTSQYSIFLLVPKAVVVRGPLEVRAATGIVLGARDYFTYNNPNIGNRSYWIDQVEPRWPGFPNEHKIVVSTQRGFNP